MKVPTRTILLFLLASFLTSSTVLLFIYFNQHHAGHRLQPAIGLSAVAVFIVICSKMVRYQHRLACAKKNLDEAQQLAALGSWKRNLVTGTGYWSENRFRLFGLQPRKTAPSMDEFYALIHPADRERTRETIATAIRTANGYEMTYRLANDVNDRIFVSRGTVQLDHTGKPVSIVGTIQDITEKVRQSRMREELIKQKDIFITRLGHDLRTPLTPLVALLPLIRSNTEDQRQRELIEICIKNVSHIKELVAKTIELARLSATSVPPSARADIQLAATVDSCIANLADVSQAHRITIENLIPPAIVVQADRQELDTVFSNLISNALKFTRSDARVTICATSEQGVVTVTVRDSGIGLSTEEHIQIFDEFYKADPSRHELGSSGLGLSICSRIIKHHGGRIWAESPGFGSGTAINFTLAAGGDP